MEQASGSIMTVYMRSLPTCLSLLCCGPLLLFGSWSTTIIAIAFQVNTGVSYFLDYVEDIYDDGPLCPV